MSEGGASKITEILETIIQSTRFAPSLITSVSELDTVHDMAGRFSTFAILTPEDDAPLVHFATKDLIRTHGKVDIVTFKECSEGTSPRYKIIVVSRKPSKPELEAIMNLLDLSIEVNDVDLVITSEVLETLKPALAQYQWQNETRTNKWNRCAVTMIETFGSDDDDPSCDNDLIEDEDRIIQGAN